jgi:uncharacterized phage protein gp47/JayE
VPDLPNRTDLFGVFASEVLTRAQSRSTGQQITASEIFTPGSDINLIGAAGSAMAEEVMRQLGRSEKELTLDGSQGNALDRWVFDRYSEKVPRKTAAVARATVTLARPTGTFGGFTYPAGSRVTTPGGIQFATQTDAIFTGAALGPVSVIAKAVNAGTAGNVAANSITRFVTTPVDATATITNPQPATGGDATEVDTAYRARARAYLLSLARGTLPAIEFGAETVPGVRQSSAIEETDGSGVPTGRVFLFIADANGQANLALTAEVVTALREYRAAGIPVIVVGGTPVFQTITYALSFETGIDTVLAFDQVRQATVARVNQLAPQEALRRSMLFEIARSIAGVIVPSDAVTVPAGDVIPPAASGQVLRTSPELVTNA